MCFYFSIYVVPLSSAIHLFWWKVNVNSFHSLFLCTKCLLSLATIKVLSLSLGFSSLPMTCQGMVLFVFILLQIHWDPCITGWCLPSMWLNSLLSMLNISSVPNSIISPFDASLTHILDHLILLQILDTFLFFIFLSLCISLGDFLLTS